MKLRRITAIIAAGTLAMVGAAVGPATAATDSTTNLTVTLNAGSISIAAPASASASASVTPGSAISVSLTDTTVTDNRGSLLGWTVTGSATDLVNGSYTIPKTGLVWATGTIATTNGALTNVAVGAGGSMASTFAVASALALFGTGTYTYPATITGVVPVNVGSGAYTGTVTQSVA